PEGSIYSYQDGDMTFAWSPDGRWLTATTGSIVRSTEVVLLDATGKLAPMDISQSGYRDSDPQFTADGKAIVWTTDRNGLRQA
ncbi:MAG: PD40 domain-containing protein, partial [Rhodoferax sp.]|nr:PD40 domain-containing protein [Rhodoferax sp.]